MKITIFLLFFQSTFLLNTRAQTQVITKLPQDQSDTGFQPSLVIVILILAIMFFLTFCLLLYAKFCHTRASILHANDLRIPAGSMRRPSGVDKTVIESLPFFRFSALKGSKEGLECAVCLARFEDVEILRLLPKCKHAFHIGCIDLWLEKHSSCPLCRNRVTADDLATSGTSLRFLNHHLEMYIEREESSRFGSFRWKSEKNKKTEKETETLPMRLQSSEDNQKNQRPLHHLNHRIIVSDVVMKNRWSNVSSSDLMALTSELIRDVSSCRFSSIPDQRNRAPDYHEQGSCRDGEEIQIMNLKEEMERKRLFEYKIKHSEVCRFPTTSAEPNSTKLLSLQDEKRSMSEIVVHPRFFNGNLQDSSRNSNEERRRNLWIPIARRTAQWFAKRETRSADQSQHTTQSLNI